MAADSPIIPRAKTRFDTARRTRVLHLTRCGLEAVPAEVWQMGSTLLRLDLGFNRLRVLPAAVAELGALEQLWLNGNRLLVSLPAEIEQCKKLRVLDVRDTALAALPNELSRIKSLVLVDLRGTPFAAADPASAGEASAFTTQALVASIARRDRRENSRLEILDKVRAGIYREVADSALGQQLIPVLVQAVCDEFEDLDELRNVVRNCDRLFPTELAAARNARAAARRLRAQFVELRRNNEKKKLSAELELKLRAIYYDRVEPRAVEEMVRGVYAGDWAVEKELTLEDIKFTIKNAARLFPEDPAAVTGPVVRANVWELQQTLTADRNGVLEKLHKALSSNLYPDREPADVWKLTRAVGKLFERDLFATKRELDEMRKLAADAPQHFPAEFLAAVENPAAVRTSFKRAAAASASMTL